MEEHKFHGNDAPNENAQYSDIKTFLTVRTYFRKIYGYSKLLELFSHGHCHWLQEWTLPTPPYGIKVRSFVAHTVSLI